MHVAFTFDYIEGSPNAVKIYVNGVLLVDSTTNYQVFSNPDTPFAVGKRATANQNYLDGAIDDLYLYGRVLTQAEIAEKAGIENLPPVVDAGEIKKIIQPASTVFLNGSLVDDHPAQTTVAWSLVDDPNNTAVFDPVDDPNTTVTLTTVGDYRVRLTATDSFGDPIIVSDDTVIKVRPAGFDGLEAYIPFENADPNLAVDNTVAGLVYPGTIYGDPNAGFGASDAMVGSGALELFGAEHVDYSQYLGAENQITVMFWAKPHADGLGANQHVIQKWPSDSSWLGWMTRIRTADNWSALIGSGFNADGTFLQGPTQIPVSADTWVHLAFTFDGTVLNLFQDGVHTDSVVLDEPYSPADIVTPMVIGYRSNNDSSYFTGLIDEVRIYDYALSQADIVSQVLADGGTLPTTCASEALSGDLTEDCYVDLIDIAELGASWLGGYDIDNLLNIAETWLDCVDPTDSSCL
jgi:hypothetical protein